MDMEGGVAIVTGSSSGVGAACARQIGLRRTQFTTGQSVQDLERVREALGLERWSVGGVSYGTFVATSYARTFPDRLSAVLAFVTPPDSGPKAFPAIMGADGQNLPSTLPNGMGFDDYFLISNRVGVGDVPFMRWIDGTHDTVVLWDKRPPIYQAVDDDRWGTHIYWDQRGHVGWDGLWDGRHWTHSPLLSAASLTRFRRDESFPAFSATDVSPLRPGIQPDPGDPVLPANGADWGTWGGWLDWDQTSLVDTASEWGVDVHFTHPSPQPFEMVPHTVELTLTVRRPQQLLLAPGETFDWTWTDLGAPQPRQSGQGVAGPDGVVSVPGLLIEGRPARLEVRPAP